MFDVCSTMSESQVERIVTRHRFTGGKDKEANEAICITMGLIDCTPYLHDRKQELINKGYTMFDGLFKEFGGKKFHRLKSLGTHQWFDDLIKYFNNAFKRSTTTGSQDFQSIANVGDEEDKPNARQGIGRYQSSNKCVMDHMETKENVTYAKYRALADVRMGMALNMLNLSTQAHKIQAMVCPDTGSRCLVTTKGCPRQDIHSDRDAMGAQATIVEKKNPGYFTVATGQQAAFIWAVPGSHISIARTDQKDIFSLNAVSTAEKVRISPYSLFIGRGDLQHAGAGRNDYLTFKEPQYRLHSMFFPDGDQFPNNIKFVENYQPHFSGDTDPDAADANNNASDSMEDDSQENQEDVDDDERVLHIPKRNVSDDSPKPAKSQKDEDSSDSESEYDSDKDGSEKGKESDEEDFVEPPPVPRKTKQATPKSAPKRKKPASTPTSSKRRRR